MECTAVTVDINDEDAKSDRETGKRLPEDETKLNILRVQVLFWIFFGRSVEMVIVFPLTVLAVKWQPLTQIIEQVEWSLAILLILSLIILKGLQRIPALTRFPGFFILRLIYLLFLIGLYFAMAVQFPHLYYWLWPNFSPYLAVVAAGTAGASYIFCLSSIVVIMQKENGEPINLYISGMLMPFLLLFSSQLVYYFAYYNDTYKVFMLNAVGGIVLGCLSSMENIYVSRKLIHSEKMKEEAGKMEVISLLRSGPIAALIFS